MAENLSQDSLRAGEIISFLSRTKFLTPQEKIMLLKHIPYKGLVKRLLNLAFSNNIFRYLDLNTICKKRTYDLVGADERLSAFVRLHEEFVNEEISVKKLVAKVSKLMRVLHVREFAFYEDLMRGGTCYLDYGSYRKALLKKDEVIKGVKFMRPFAAIMNQAWGGKRYIIQPNYQGIQFRIILDRDDGPKCIAGDNLDYASRLKGTLAKAQEFLDEYEDDHMEFDAILIPKDKKARPYVDWKAKEHVLVVYDYVNKNMPLKKRLKVCKALVDFVIDLGSKRMQMMPSELVTGPMIAVEAKRFVKSSNPYCSRNGIVVKQWDSGYEFKRSSKWLTYYPIHDETSGTFLGRATLVSLMPSRSRVGAVDNSNTEIEVTVPEHIFDNLTRYLGYTIEFAYFNGYYNFRRVLYDKGREV